ncbi:MAG: hypothetical protein ABSA02_30155 [Trebonia sp.]|jgi:hypothetical protein
MAPDPGPGIDGRPPPARRQVETLGVADVVVSILEARKEKPWANAAAVWRQHRGGTVYVRVILMESASAPSPAPGEAGQEGRAEVIGEFAARRLGEDLITAFGAKDVIILS